MNNDMQIIFSNYECREGSFVHSLSELNTFDEKYYWIFYNSVISLTKENLNAPLNRDLTRAIVMTYSKVMTLLWCHLSTDDQFEINNYPSEKIHLFTERLEFMVDGYLGGFIMSESSFGDEIINPSTT